METGQLQPFCENVWIYEGSEVSFYGFPFPTRMTVIRLPDERLWVHSPELLTDALQHELSLLGRVCYLISPNKLHHLFLQPWLESYPDAKSYAAPGLIEKRPDLRFDTELDQHSDPLWADEIDQLLFQGSRAMEEAVFFHKQSRTLILTDLIENFDPATLNLWQRGLAGFAGILSPRGKTPIDWRLTFHLGDRELARQCLNRMLEWQPEKIVLSHGNCIHSGASRFLEQSFSWLQKTG